MDQLEVGLSLQIDRLRRELEHKESQLSEARKLIWSLLPHANVLAVEREQALNWLHQFEWSNK